MIPMLVLFLREGLEASLIVGILLAALRQIGQPRLTRAVWWGVGLALLTSFAIAAVLYFTASTFLGPDGLLVFKIVTYLIAIVILTSMTFWVQRHSANLKRELTAQMTTARSSAFAVGALAFTTVGREGLETAVFALAFAFAAGGSTLLLGALLGVAGAVLLGVLVYHSGYRLNYRIFFRVMGLLLIVFAAALLSNAIQAMQSIGWLPFAADPVWNTSGALSEGSDWGAILHTFLGYAEAPSLLQVVAYVAYLVGVGALFFWTTRRRSTAPRSETPLQAAAAPQSSAS